MAVPYDSLRTLALVVGVWLIVIGIMEVVTAFGIRDSRKSVGRPNRGTCHLVLRIPLGPA